MFSFLECVGLRDAIEVRIRYMSEGMERNLINGGVKWFSDSEGGREDYLTVMKAVVTRTIRNATRYVNEKRTF